MNQDSQAKKKVGLAISGGWIRAAAAIGVIEILEENGIPIDIVSGCSAGSVVAAAYAAGNLGKLKRRFASGKFKEYWDIMFEPALPREGLLKGERVKNFWKEFVGDKTFAELEKPLFLTATDLKSLSSVTIDSGNVAEAIQACLGVPGMFVPVKLGEKVMSDGGNLNLIPSQALYENGADYVIAVDVSKRPNFATRGFSVFKKKFSQQRRSCDLYPIPCREKMGLVGLIWRAANLSAANINNFYHFSYRYDQLIRPDVAGIRRWDIGKVDHLVKKGREESLKTLVKIRRDLGL